VAQGSDEWRAPVNSVINIRSPENTANIFTSYATVSFSITTLFNEVRQMKDVV
jgi:hypothetical protein